MDKPDGYTCPLCQGQTIRPYHQDKTRTYVNCGTCDLVFVPPQYHLSVVEEMAYYDLHENRPDDPGYRNFLDRLFTPLHEKLAPNSRGLDFGCGPGPTLSVMFEEAGHSVSLYDPYYVPDLSVFSVQYDFITLSEVVEHMGNPGQELYGLWTCLKPGGWLAIMTKRVMDTEAFKGWHYITDPTHICYFSDVTFQWIVDGWSSMGETATLRIVGNDVVLIQKGLDRNAG